MARVAYKTKSKRDILEYLKGVGTAATVEDIHLALPSIDLSTIYRNLERMTGEGKVLKFPDEKGRKACYQASRSHECRNHLHLKCSSCGKVIHLDCGVMQAFSDHLEKKHGFRLSCGTTVLNGLCDECRKKERKEKKEKATSADTSGLDCPEGE